MIRAQGRAQAKIVITGVRELTLSEVQATPREEAATTHAPAQLRDSHHMIARLLAMGLRPFEVAEQTGYSITRISMLKAGPDFQNLIAKYRELVDEEFRADTNHYFQQANRARLLSANYLIDKLEAGAPEDFTVSQLVSIHADFADRTGYPKRKESVNFNIDFASRLDAAVKRSRSVKTIEGNVVALPPKQSPPGIPSVDRGGVRANASPPAPLRRRV